MGGEGGGGGWDNESCRGDMLSNNHTMILCIHSTHNEHARASNGAKQAILQVSKTLIFCCGPQ